VGLGYDITNSDAIRWHYRSQNFLTAVKSGDLRSTYQRYHPGVSMMWVNAAVKQAGFWVQLPFTAEPKTLENSDWYPIIHGVSKAVNILIIGGLLLIQYFCIERLFNKKIALTYLFFVATEPYLTGINRWFHLTSFEVFFSFTSFLLILLWSKTKITKFLMASAIFFGLGVLSKMTVLILGPVIGAIIIYISYKEKKYKWIAIYPTVVIGVIIALFPAIWVDPLYVFNKLFSALVGSVTDNLRDQMLSPWVKPFYYLIILILKISPIVTGLLVLSFFKIKKFSIYTMAILLYLLFFLITLTLADQKIDRYAIALFPPILLLAAILFEQFDEQIKRIIIFAHLLLLIIIIFIYHPVYSAFYDPLIGGTNTALNLGLYENSGEYMSNAAFYLNQKGREVKVFVPYNIDSFKYYFNGVLTSDYSTDVDYIVISKDIDRTDLKPEYCYNIEKAFGPKFGPEVVYIYKCDKEK
jgi:hypothetical protein